MPNQVLMKVHITYIPQILIDKNLRIKKLYLFPPSFAIQATICINIDMIRWLTRSTGYCIHTLTTSLRVILPVN